jgi:hypothetical protein
MREARDERFERTRMHMCCGYVIEKESSSPQRKRLAKKCWIKCKPLIFLTAYNTCGSFYYC